MSPFTDDRYANSLHTCSTGALSSPISASSIVGASPTTVCRSIIGDAGARACSRAVSGPTWACTA